MEEQKTKKKGTNNTNQQGSGGIVWSGCVWWTILPSFTFVSLLTNMDQARDIERTDTGINTVEGNVAGARAGRLTKKRDEEQAAYEKRKKQIQEDAKRGARNIDDRFNSSSLTSNTVIVGLY